MKELQEILKKISNFAPDEKAVLATVVDVQGSAYRLPGAKMLITKTGETFGTVSGGCLEADVLERAKKVLQTGEPQVFVYDTTANEDSVFSLNMGCRGVVRILLENVQGDYLEFLKNCFQNNETGVVATLIERRGTTQTETKDWKIGSRMFVKSNYEVSLNFNDYGIWKMLYESCVEVLKERKSRLKTFSFIHNDYSQIEKLDSSISDLCDINEFFIEFIKPPTSLVIFGAGADAVPLYEIAKNLGWRVSVVDYRPAFANAERFPEADEILLLRPENVSEKLTVHENTIAVVMTHNYESDKHLQKFLLGTKAKYIGALGPKKRTEKLLEEIGESWRENLYAPIGLDIGAETPEEIGLAIIAEIQSVLKNRNGGFLRDRQGGIH